MCGRYAASAAQATLIETFEIVEVPESVNPAALLPRWNIAPTDPVAAVVERANKQTGQVVRKLVTPRWGLVPSWSKDAKSGARMINARSETVAEKPAFRKAFATRRCLIPADGYYEWYELSSSEGGRPPSDPPLDAAVNPSLRGRSGAASGGMGSRKQPFFIQPTSGVLGTDQMVMAGIYEFWRDRQADPDDPDAWLTTCSIITTQAIDSLGVIHDRMPMQVAPHDWVHWLDPNLTDPVAAHDLLHIPEPDAMTAHAVSTLVNSVGNDGPELIAPMPDADEPSRLTDTPQQNTLWEA